MEQVKTAAIVLAAGHGKRMHSKVAKQYLLLKGEPVVVHALRAFEKAGMDEIILVTGADEVEFCKKDIVAQYNLSNVRQVVPGGKERYDSVWNGLKALMATGFPEDGIVLIHDGARPLVNGAIIARSVDGAPGVLRVCSGDAGEGHDQSGGRGWIFRQYTGSQYLMADPDPPGVPVQADLWCL